ncbi:MAG TPA: cytochrome c [Longimicrobiales bacterium]|nr:cytochrome c [Longimicrobiales bacterium]
MAACLCCSPSPDQNPGNEGRERDAGADASASSAARRSVWSGVYSAEQAARGRGAYVEECSDCHLPDLSGNDVAPPLRGDPFLEKRAGSTVGDLYALVRSTMPQDRAFSLTPQAYVDILSYLLSENDAPTGSAELDPSQNVLDLIAFDSESAGQP